MTAYRRKPGDSIQAGLAFNALRLLHHYDDLTATLLPDEKYEATLALAVLQMLLTNMADLHDRLNEVQAELVFTPLEELPHEWHLEPKFVRNNKFPGPVSLRAVVKHLRDAVSHPTRPRKGTTIGTGYTSPDEVVGLVGSFRFVHSPWVEGKEVSRYTRAEDAGKAIDRFQSWIPKDGPAFELAVEQEQDGKYVVTHEGKRYVPEFTMEIPVSELMGFTKELANFIGQPIIPGWNGRPIRRLMLEPELAGVSV